MSLIILPLSYSPKYSWIKMWQYNKCALYILTYNVCVNLREYPNFNLFIGVFSHRWLVYTLNFLPYKPTGPVSSNIYRPTINSTGPNLKTTLTTIIQTTKTQNMMMYQILCGHVNYALGKTKMQVKKTKRHFILDSIMFILLLIS